MSGLWTLIKLILRRDRLKLPLWIVGIVGSLLLMVPLLEDTYGEQQALATLFQTFSVNPAGIMLTGPMDAPTFGALMTIETLLWWGFVVAFMNTLFIVRHTRQNEEMGAEELLMSGVTHRSAGLKAALIVAFFVNMIIALLIGFGLGAITLEWDFDQSLLYGISFGLFGFVWATLAAIVVQLFESSRSANGMLAGAIGVAFLIRGVGDFLGDKGVNGLLDPAWPSWISPFGWMQATHSLTFPEWWPLIIPVIVACIVTPVAFFLLNHRDLAAGILPSRKGHARASNLLKSLPGLSWYLQRNIFWGWLIGTLIMAATIGVLVSEISHVYEGTETVKQMIETMSGDGNEGLISQFLTAMMSVLMLMIIAYALQAIMRLRSEESNGHLENLLATRVSRIKWLWSHLSIVLIAGTIMATLTGFVMAAMVNIASDDIGVSLVDYTLAGLSYVPALMIFVGIYVLLFGMIPRLASVVVWLYFGITVFMTWIAPLLKLDDFIMKLSPLEFLARAPAESVEILPIVSMVAITITLLVIGLFMWRKRDLAEK